NRAGSFSASFVTGPTDSLSIWNGGATATADAVGIDGGAGDDRLVNTARDAEPDGTDAGITVDATATARAGSVNLSGAGLTRMIVSSAAESSARGLDGGAGDDLIRNAAPLSVSAFSDARSVGVGFTGAGIT